MTISVDPQLKAIVPGDKKRLPAALLELKIIRLHTEGMTAGEIKAVLDEQGIYRSIERIQLITGRVNREWRAMAVELKDQERRRQLAEMDAMLAHNEMLLGEMYNAFKLSQGKRKKTRVRGTVEDKRLNQEDAEITTQEDEMFGDPRYAKVSDDLIKTRLQILADRRKLLGMDVRLNARTDSQGNDVTDPKQMSTTDLRSRLNELFLKLDIANREVVDGVVIEPSSGT